MCTAVTYQTKDFYFGRNLDLEYHLQEAVTVTPRNYPFRFRREKTLETHYAMIGVATVARGYPLYYEATNEKGLSMAGLNFPGNAHYAPFHPEKVNITPFELIPWILGSCENTVQAQQKLEKLNLWKEPFSPEFPLSPLHWILADPECCLVVEPLKDGLQIRENPVGVLTNNPPLDYHLYRLADHMNLTAAAPENRFCCEPELRPYSLGMGALGLPGDLSSSSRFVRAAFTKLNSPRDLSQEESVIQFFHILNTVAQPKGLTAVKNNLYEFTLYSSCCNATRGIYYYTTYENSRITGVDMRREDLNGRQPITYPLLRRPQWRLQNG